MWAIPIDVKLVPVNFNWKLLRCDVAWVDSSQFLYARFSFSLFFASVFPWYFSWYFLQAGGPWALGWHGPTKTHPSCCANVPAIFESWWDVTQEPPCRLSTRIPSELWIKHMNGWRWLLIYLSAQLAQSETGVNPLSISFFCLYYLILWDSFWLIDFILLFKVATKDFILFFKVATIFFLSLDTKPSCQV